MFKMKLLIVVVMVSFIFVVGWRGYVTGQDEATQRIMLQWTQERLALSQAINAELIKVRDKEKALINSIVTLKEEHNREILTINSKHNTIVRSLQQRPPERASNTGMSSSSDPNIGCTGKGLAKPDAEFLAGYATDAAKLNEALLLCKAAYDNLKETFNK
jgi:hypothetical protein